MTRKMYFFKNFRWNPVLVIDYQSINVCKWMSSWTMWMNTPPPPLSLPFVFSIKLELCYQLIAYSKLFSWQRYFLSHEFKWDPYTRVSTRRDKCRFSFLDTVNNIVVAILCAKFWSSFLVWVPNHCNWDQ